MSIFFLSAAKQCGEAKWQPSADIYQTRRGLLIKFDLAGVRLEDVSVNIRDSYLTISGVRKDWALEEGLTYYSMEISYSCFERTIKLPFDLRHARIDTDYRDGMLVVRIEAVEREETR
ncbi:MAG TPA: Hsp20/alpha crystallin family protein [Blastocatellia bacterium]|nr:Hsp20/alpha crystallin family protein [Blastocatellia bacterium]